MVMWPRSMPTASFSTFATGARQLVVQDALLTTVCSGRSWSWLTPMTTVRSAPSAGAETSTRLAPAPRWPERLVLAGEDAGAFQNDVDAELAPGQLGEVALGQHLDRRQRLAGRGADVERVALELGLAGEAAMHAVVAEQVRVGGGRGEVVDRHHLDVVAAVLGQRAQDVAADPAEAVDGYLRGHDRLSPGCRIPVHERARPFAPRARP